MLTRWLVVVLAALSMAAQQQAPPDGTIPADHYCKARDVPISPRETKAHHCDCQMTCEFDAKCTCHTERPCPGTLRARQGWTDMSGHVVAVRRQ